jgi:hypothetical protein
MIAMMPHPPLPRALSFLHSRLASTPPRPAHHHIDLPAAATGADQPSRPGRAEPAIVADPATGRPVAVLHIGEERPRVPPQAPQYAPPPPGQSRRTLQHP